MMVGGSVLIQDEEGATSVDDGRASAGWVAPVMTCESLYLDSAS